MNYPDKLAIKLELAILERKIQALHAEFPELEHDQELNAGMIEGQTNAFELMDVACDRILHEKGLQGAIKDRMEDLATRKTLSERRSDWWRKFLLKILEMANLRKAQLSEATLTVAAGPQHVIIVDPLLIPENFWRIKREPNLTSIKEAIVSGRNVPGATLSNKEDSLRVRSK